MAGAAVGVATVPDRGRVPVNREILVFAGTAVVDVDVDGSGGAPP